MNMTVATPTLTPRIVSAERNLFARTVSSAMKADSLRSMKFISGLPQRHRGTGTSKNQPRINTDRHRSELRLSYPRVSVFICGHILFRSQRFNRIQTRRPPGRPQAADDAND